MAERVGREIKKTVAVHNCLIKHYTKIYSKSQAFVAKGVVLIVNLCVDHYHLS